MPILKFVHSVEAIQYDGSNDAEVIAAAEAFFTLVNTGVNFVSGAVVANEVVITTDQYVMTAIAVGSWLIRDRTEVYTTTDAYQNINYDVTPVVALGIAAVPTLAGSAQATVHVTINPPMPNDNYNAAAVLSGGVGLLSKLSIVSVTVVNESTVDVVVDNTGLLQLSGASVIVNAVS